MSSITISTEYGARSEGERKAAKWFVASAGVILLVTGSAKIFAAFGKAQSLNVPDPIFEMSLRHVMLLGGLLEVLVAEICLLTKKLQLGLRAVIWLSTVFLVYRLGLWWTDWKQPCRCLGSLTDSLHISPESADLIAKSALAYLLLGGCMILWSQRMKTRQAIPEM